MGCMGCEERRKLAMQALAAAKERNAAALKTAAGAFVSTAVRDVNAAMAKIMPRTEPDDVVPEVKKPPPQFSTIVTEKYPQGVRLRLKPSSIAAYHLGQPHNDKPEH